MVRTGGQGPIDGRTLPNSETGGGERHTLCASSLTIGWPEGRTPLCATNPNHRVYTGRDPCAIQSFYSLTREERSNSAPRGIQLLTLLGT